MKIIFHCQANNGSCSFLCVFKWNSKGISLFQFHRARKQPRQGSWSAWVKDAGIFLRFQETVQNGLSLLEMFKRGGIDILIMFLLSTFLQHTALQDAETHVFGKSGCGLLWHRWCWIAPAAKEGNPGPSTHICHADWGHRMVTSHSTQNQNVAQNAAFTSNVNSWRQMLSTDGPWLTTVRLYDGASDTYAVEAVLWILTCGMWYSCDSGQRPQAPAASQPRDHEGQLLIHLEPFCSHTTFLFVTFGTVFSKSQEIFNIL